MKNTINIALTQFIKHDLNGEPLGIEHWGLLFWDDFENCWIRVPNGKNLFGKSPKEIFQYAAKFGMFRQMLSREEIREVRIAGQQYLPEELGVSELELYHKRDAAD